MTRALEKPVDSSASGERQIGEKQQDGTVYVGISPDTTKPLYALPVDAPLTMKWQQAMDYAARFEGHGYPAGTFRVPTRRELNVLFQNKANIGGFNETGSYPAGWYWSSMEHRSYANWAWDQSFDDGSRDWYLKKYESSLRLVRD